MSDVNAGTSAGNAFPLITTQQFNTVFGLKRQSKETKPSIYEAVFISFVIRKRLKGKHDNSSLYSSSPMLSTNWRQSTQLYESSLKAEIQQILLDNLRFSKHNAFVLVLGRDGFMKTQKTEWA